MVSPETKTLLIPFQEGSKNHPLFLRGASPDEIKEITGSTLQVAETDQQKSTLFAQGLWEKGLIGKDLVNWNGLHELYEKYKRDLPEKFAIKLILESFCKGRIEAEKGNLELVDVYTAIAKGINGKDKESFLNNPLLREEQTFIRDALHSEYKMRNGNNNVHSRVIREAIQSVEEDYYRIYREELNRNASPPESY